MITGCIKVDMPICVLSNIKGGMSISAASMRLACSSVIGNMPVNPSHNHARGSAPSPVEMDMAIPVPMRAVPDSMIMTLIENVLIINFYS